jgi:hypothetical protein
LHCAQGFKQTYGASAKPNSTDPNVSTHFVGAWDTVDAYGPPIDEAKKALAWLSGFLDKIPLLRRFAVTRFKDFQLSERVTNAYHAVALDDERHSFHPVLWDERDKKKNQTVEQVWFAGIHADVGGGYTRASLSLEPLHWMLQKAETCDFRFDATHKERIEQERSAARRLHDSCSGVCVYYRYRPRHVSALCAQRHVAPVRVHTSVLERIKLTGESGLPNGLPSAFEVEGGAATNTGHRPNCAALDAVRGVTCWRGALYYSSLTWTIWLLSTCKESVVNPRGFSMD